MTKVLLAVIGHMMSLISSPNMRPIYDGRMSKQHGQRRIIANIISGERWENFQIDCSLKEVMCLFCDDNVKE